MKKKLLVLLAMVTVLTTGVFAVQASPPEAAAGSWTYAPSSIIKVVTAGCNQFTYMIDEGTFDGTFTGTEMEIGVVTEHCNGRWSYKGNLTFTGTVNGQSGTLEMRIVGRADDFSDWLGTWVILSGTNELENLHGQGTWYGAPGNLEYEGNIHFEGP
jgi:hypothetical protein